ncbi:MAG: molybdopterin-dependent oxidoreductase [Rhodobacteraceae bacterium]|nr:molybdopterin-dependent oxidoreductase [Paracoccaceae bacterium]
MTSFEFRREFFADERQGQLNEIGKPTIRQDILGHVTGRSPYYDDHLFDGLLHMRCVRSPHHHARIVSVDFSEAARMEGVRRVVGPDDVPKNLNTLLSLIGFGKEDEPLLTPSKVAYRGEPILAIVAESERQARAAVQAVRVEWEELPHVLDVEEALKPNAPVVNATYPGNTFEYYDKYDHQKLRFGDVEQGFAKADQIVEGSYRMSPIEQAPMETCGAIAVPETNDRIACYTSTQALFFSLATTAKLLDMSSARLHFVGGTVGGGFGGKVDSIVEPMSVLGALLTGAPVKFMWDREEEMQVGAPRGAELWKIKDGIDSRGRIVARSFTGYFDSGAYTRLSSYAVVKATGHLPGPYSIPNVASNVFCVFTNRTPATAMRGFGITGVDFAIECQMDRGARATNMNPIDFRILNAYRDGDMKAHRRLAKNTALIECCQVVADKARWIIGSQSRTQSSLRGGGGEKAHVPATVIDEEGRIGDRRRSDVPTAPHSAGGRKRRLPEGSLRGEDVVAAPPQNPDMLGDAPASDPAASPENGRTLARPRFGPPAEVQVDRPRPRRPQARERPAIPAAPARPSTRRPLRRRTSVSRHVSGFRRR